MTRENFIAIANEKYDKLQSSAELTSLYDYELALYELMQEFGQAVMEKELRPHDIHSKKKSSSHRIW